MSLSGTRWRDSGFGRGARRVAPLAPAIGILGVVFGYVARSADLPWPAAVVMSATTFAGSPQFAAIAVFVAGGSVAAAVAAAAAMASRFGVMSATAAGDLPASLWKRVLLAQFVVDETWSIAYAPETGFDRQMLIGAGLTLYVVHVTGTALGAVFGNFVGRPETWGVDAMPPALFVVLMAPHLITQLAWLTLAVVAVVTAVAIPFTQPGIPVLIAIGATVAIALTTRNRGDIPA
ncbi:MAG TPA: AzlC family ABC transporter permease [Gemmatimonadaceae bacterium]|nr:AzlC family ABC transporter permease [Gemmatimonadaceae bacterium]